MSLSLVTFETSVVVENKDVDSIVRYFESGSLTKDLYINNDSFQLEESKLLEIEDISTGEEELIYTTKPIIEYYLSGNKEFSLVDMIRIDGLDYQIVLIKGMSITLYNADELQSINFKDIFSIMDLRLELEKNKTIYQVIRRIK